MRFFYSLILAVCCITPCLALEPALRPGDRVTLVGGTFVERMQIHGHFEAEIRSRLDGDIQFRNLGWAGDNVLGESRAVFGTIEKGMERLLRDLQLTRPTVIVICYGSNEAHAGEAGLDAFSKNLASLVTKLEPLNTRFIFVAPRPYENLGSPLPNPERFNTNLTRYSTVIKQLAHDSDAHFIDLARLDPVVTRDPLQSSSEEGPWILEEHTGLTSNGLHLTSYGYWRLASSFADALGLAKAKVIIAPQGDSEGVSGLTLEHEGETIRLQGRFQQLHLPPIPNTLGNAPIQATLKIRDLAQKRYQVKAGDKSLGVATNKELKDGFQITIPTNPTTIFNFRDSIIEKNMLFFHRHRPQNETYLFLFRKHEQGNNAGEVTQFDELVEKHDRLIYEYSNSRDFSFTITPVKK